jgi:hypothetical protein
MHSKKKKKLRSGQEKEGKADPNFAHKEEFR